MLMGEELIDDLFIHSMPKGAFLASCFRDGKSDPPFFVHTLWRIQGRMGRVGLG